MPLPGDAPSPAPPRRKGSGATWPAKGWAVALMCPCGCARHGRDHCYYTPVAVEAVAAEAPLQVAATLEPRQIRVGEPVTLPVSALLRSGTALDIPLTQVGLPAGFDCDRAALEALVRGRKIEKFELAPRAVVLYLRRLAPGSEVALRLPMQARLSGQMQLPEPVLYEYYQPERWAEGQAQRVQVAW